MTVGSDNSKGCDASEMLRQLLQLRDTDSENALSDIKGTIEDRKNRRRESR